jgi:hypothetical protein
MRFNRSPERQNYRIRAHTRQVCVRKGSRPARCRDNDGMKREAGRVRLSAEDLVCKGSPNVSSPAPVGRSSQTGAALWISVVALMWCDHAGAARAADPHADADRAAIEVLRAGLDRWERSVEFRCAFRYRTTFAPRIEDARQGKVDDSLGPPEGLLDVQGDLFKKGDRVRLRLDYGQRPKPLGSLPGGNWPHMNGPRMNTPLFLITNVSYDECSNGEVIAAYNFPHDSGDPHNELHFSQLKPHSGRTEPRPSLGGFNAAGQLNPLNPLGNARGRPLEPWDFGDAVQSESATVQTLSAHRRQIHLRRVSSSGTQERWITVWTEPEPPVVESIVEEVKEANGKGTIRTEIVMRKFISCPGGLVPSEIVQAIRNSKSPVIQARIWSSDDLGSQPVKDEDFIIRTEPKALVIGLQHPPADANGNRQFDMNKITLSDLEVHRNAMRRSIRRWMGLPP